MKERSITEEEVTEVLKDPEIKYPSHGKNSNTTVQKKIGLRTIRVVYTKEEDGYKIITAMEMED